MCAIVARAHISLMTRLGGRGLTKKMTKIETIFQYVSENIAKCFWSETIGHSWQKYFTHLTLWHYKISTIMDKIFETNFRFHIKQSTKRKKFLFFSTFLLAMTKLGESLVNNFTNFKIFLIFPNLLKSLWGNLYTQFLLLITRLSFTCSKRKIW